MMMFYILISALAFLFLYFYIKKFTNKLDEENLLEPIKADIYPKFCDFCDEEIRNLKDNISNNEIKFLDENKKDDFLEKLSDLSRKLTFIQTMNLSKKNNQIWESELFDFLKELEDLINEFLKDGEEISDNIRNKLFDKFNKLKN